MIRSFLKSSAYYFVANAIAKIVTFAFWAYLARVLTIDEMGKWAMLNVLLTIITFFMTLDLPSGFNRFFLEFKDESKRSEFEFSFINFIVLVNVFIGGALFFAKPLVERAVFPMSNHLFMLLLTLPLLGAINGAYLCRLRLENRVAKVLVISLVQPVVYIGVSILALHAGMGKIQAVFLGMGAQYLPAIPFYLADLWGYRMVLSPRSLKSTFIFSAYLFPSLLGTYLSLLASKYLLGKLADTVSLGIFEANSKITMILGMFMDPLYLATSPIIYRHYNEAGFSRRHFQLVGINAFALLILTLPVGIFSRDLVRILVGEKYVAHAILVFPLLIVAVLTSLSKFFAINEHLAKKTQYDVVPELGAGLLNILLSVVLIRKFGINGSVVALTITNCFRFAVYCVFAKWFLPSLFVGYRYIAGYFAMFTVMLAINLVLSQAGYLLRGGTCIIEFIVLGWMFITTMGLGSGKLIFRPWRLWAMPYRIETRADA